MLICSRGTPAGPGRPSSRTRAGPCQRQCPPPAEPSCAGARPRRATLAAHTGTHSPRWRPPGPATALHRQALALIPWLDSDQPMVTMIAMLAMIACMLDRELPPRTDLLPTLLPSATLADNARSGSTDSPLALVPGRRRCCKLGMRMGAHAHGQAGGRKGPKVCAQTAWVPSLSNPCSGSVFVRSPGPATASGCFCGRLCQAPGLAPPLNPHDATARGGRRADRHPCPSTLARHHEAAVLPAA